MADNDRRLDKVKAELFIKKDAALLAHVLCNVYIIPDNTCATAYTNSLVIGYNPDWYFSLPFQTQITVLAHELWHIALMHCFRGNGLDPEVFNQACDIYINNGLEDDGYTFEGTKPWLDHYYNGWAILDIYEDLIKKGQKPKPNSGAWGFGGGDLSDKPVPPELAEECKPENVISVIIQASISAGTEAGRLTDSVNEVISRFLRPKVAWPNELTKFMTELGDEDFSLSRRNRRIRDAYVGSLVELDEGALTHVANFVDTSGSISLPQGIRFNSEIKFIKDRFKPTKLTLLNFDTEIQQETVFNENDPYDFVDFIGRGGTDLTPVRDWIIKNRPTAVIIYSDLYCAAMEPLPADCVVPIIWLVINNPTAQVPHGKMIHIQEK